MRCEPGAGDEPARSSAGGVWTGHQKPPAALAAAAAFFSSTLAAAPGRVQETSQPPPAEALAALAAALPSAWRTVLRPTLVWYGCRGAFFHNDAHFGRVLFGVWCAGGPAREVVYPRLGLRVPATPGDLVVFDPFEPHGVLDPGQHRYVRERYLDAEPSAFVGFELELDAAVGRDFLIGTPPEHGLRLSSRSAVNAESGAVG